MDNVQNCDNYINMPSSQIYIIENCIAFNVVHSHHASTAVVGYFCCVYVFADRILLLLRIIRFLDVVYSPEF
jgi:hypothetical protein